MDRAKMVSRVAAEYTQVVYLLGKARAEACSVVETISGRVDSIRTRLSVELSRLLLDALDDDADLRQVLRTYELVEGWEEAEEIVREHFQSVCKEVSGRKTELIADHHVVRVDQRRFPLCAHDSGCKPIDQPVRQTHRYHAARSAV